MFAATGKFNGKMTATASSVYRNYGTRKASNAVDGKTSTYFTSGGKMDWLQLDLGEEQTVAGIEATKRAAYPTHLVNLEVRVGNAAAKRPGNTKLLTINAVCGTVPSAKTTQKTAKVTCASPLSGRYITIQSKANNYIQITEVAVFTVTPGAVISSGGSGEGDGSGSGGGIEKVFLPSLCSDNGDPYCDPNWTPFGNMNMALMGYDLINGDPMAKGGDIGFRSQIFGAVVTDDYGRMVLSDGIAAVDMLECESNFDSKTVSTLSVRIFIDLHLIKSRKFSVNLLGIQRGTVV